VDFKPNTTLENRFVRLGLHSLIYSKLISSLVDVELPTWFVQAKGNQLTNM